jgi:antitoxin (DNA-binding transcriptional repressor) of toxin-antitoxin stability system
MKASVLDLRRRMADVIRALDRDEPVTILYRGKKKGILYPIRTPKRASPCAVSDHPAFGMWKDRQEMRNVQAFVRMLREGRTHDV